MTTGLHYEELEIGAARSSLGRTVTETDVVNFVALANMYEPLFADIEYIENESLFGRRIAPGALSYALAEGLVLQMGVLHGTGLAFLGAEFNTPAPVFVGDTLYVDQEVIDKRTTSKPDRGVVTFRETLRNQRGEEVLVRTIKRMVRRAPVSASSES
jgi:acyl dehydratase